MDTDTLVENKIEDGEILVRQLVREQFGVTVAFWARINENGLWYLYIASPSFDPNNPGEAIRIVYAALTTIPRCSVTPLEIMLLANTDLIARDAVALRDRYPSREPKRYHAIRLGNLETVELLIYPRALPWKVRELPDGKWQVLISEFDDQWLDCDSKDDAQAIAAAPVLRDEALDRVDSSEQFTSELEKTADIMQKYRLGFGSRFLRGLAHDIRQEAAAQPA